MAHTTQITILENNVTSDSSQNIPSMMGDGTRTDALVYDVTEEVTDITRYGPDFRLDSLFVEALQHIQQGEWQQAVLMLHTSQSKYPDTRELDFIMSNALMKAELESN